MLNNFPKRPIKTVKMGNIVRCEVFLKKIKKYPIYTTQPIFTLPIPKSWQLNYLN